MKNFELQTKVIFCDDFKDMLETINLNSYDTIITNSYIYDSFKELIKTEPYVIFQEKYGKGEPTDEMIDEIRKDLSPDTRRIIAIGGGTVIDISKILTLKAECTEDLYKTDRYEKQYSLTVCPTTCGTGSEVTNVAICALTKLNIKKGIANSLLYPDTAVLCPELLSTLPYQVFATSSIDALIHAIESLLSPKASYLSSALSLKAIDTILNNYLKLSDEHSYKEDLDDYLKASLAAGIAFSNAGCGTIHAMSYPLGARYHIPHGLSNLLMFEAVIRKYEEVNPDGRLLDLKMYLSKIFNCDTAESLDWLFKTVDSVLKKQPLKEYGVNREIVNEFAVSVYAQQQRLLSNSYIPVNTELLKEIYSDCLGE